MVSGTSSPWFMRSLMSGLRSRREDMVSERCRPLLSRYEGCVCPFALQQSTYKVQSTPARCILYFALHHVPWLQALHSARMVQVTGMKCKERRGQGSSHRARGAIQPHNLSGTLYPLQAATKCSVQQAVTEPATLCLHLRELAAPSRVQQASNWVGSKAPMRRACRVGWLTSLVLLFQPSPACVKDNLHWKA